MIRPTIRHRIEYGVFRAVAGVVQRLPERWALGVGAGLGWLAGSVLRIRRGVVEENLLRAFPEQSAAWRHTIAAASYLHLGREAITLLRLQRLTAEELIERVDFEGLDLVQSALDEGVGPLILTGHLGNWEVGGAAVAACGIPLDAVARVQSNPLFNQQIVRTRERMGIRVVDRDHATRHILRCLREPRAVAMVADQGVGVGGMFIEFFGAPAATARGPGLLAMRTGARVLLAITHRIHAPVARYRIRFTPLRLPEAQDKEEALRRFLRRYLRGIEDAIREAPEQYFWMHRRWKRTPPEEPSTSAAVRDRHFDEG